MARITGSARKAWQGATPSRDEQHRLKREAVVKAAARAFSRNGFHGTSLDQIAKELNVTKAALYYYVKNKGDILLACLGHAAAIGDAALDYGRKAGKTGREKLLLTLNRYVDDMTRDMGGLALIGELRALPAKEQAAVIAARDKFDRALREIVQEGIRDGSIVGCDPKLAVFIMMGAINWLPRWYSPQGERTGSEIAAAFIALFENGLAPRRR
jgi:TetR/AcrR family transcriptional regulator